MKPEHCQHCHGYHRVETPASAWSCIRSLAGRVGVQKPVERKCRRCDKNEAWICDACEDELLECQRKAWANNKPRQQLSRWGWAELLRAAFAKHTGHNTAAYEPAPFLAEADAILAKLAELEQPVEIDEDELAKAIHRRWQKRNVGNVAWDELSEQGQSCYRDDASAAIAYFQERANVTTNGWTCNKCGTSDLSREDCDCHKCPTRLVPPVVTDSMDAGQSVGKVEYKDEWPIEERAKRLHDKFCTAFPSIDMETWPKTTWQPGWLAVAREVESEIKAAKREAFIEAHKQWNGADLSYLANGLGLWLERKAAE